MLIRSLEDSLAHWCTMAMWSIVGGDGRCTTELEAP